MMRTARMPLATLGLLAACVSTPPVETIEVLRQNGGKTVVGQADMQAFCRGEVLETIEDSPFITVGPLETTDTGFSVVAKEIRAEGEANTYLCTFFTNGAYDRVTNTSLLSEMSDMDTTGDQIES